MNIFPIYYVIAIFIMLVALFSLRYEFTYLRHSKVSVFDWIISILNFITVISLLVVLLAHHKIEKLLALKLILTFLVALLIISGIQLFTRRKVFRATQLELRKQRKKMIDEMRDIIDEKKRSKIREKYGEDDSDKDSSDPDSNGKSNL